jgi:hypothetical protein
MQSAADTYADLRRCGCDLDHLGRKPRNEVKSYDIQMIDGLPDKARIYPGAFRIQIDRTFWAGLSETHRHAVLAHELAHDEDPNGCESCTDARAGARMRWLGFSQSLAVSSLSSVVSRRGTREAVMAGWRAADQTIKDRGGTGPIAAGGSLSTTARGVPLGAPSNADGDSLGKLAALLPPRTRSPRPSATTITTATAPAVDETDPNGFSEEDPAVLAEREKPKVPTRPTAPPSKGPARPAAQTVGGLAIVVGAIALAYVILQKG